MKQNNSGNTAYLPQEDYCRLNYFGYDLQREASGCRNLFFLLVIILLMIIAGGVLVIVL